MKKFLFFVCALVAACVMSSCSGNEYVKVDSDVLTVNACKTLTDLDAYNKKFMSERAATRNAITTKDLKKGWNVVKSDVKGARKGIKVGRVVSTLLGCATGGTGAIVTNVICGSIFGGVSSYIAYKKNFDNSSVHNYTRVIVNQSPIDTTFLQVSEKVYMGNTVGCEEQYAYNIESEKVELPERYEYLKRVGEDHNALVTAVMKVDAGSSEELSLEEVKGIIPPVEATQEELDELFNNTCFIESYAEFLQELESSSTETASDGDNYISNESDFPYNVKIAIDNYIELLESCATSIDDVVEITNGYIKIIEQNNEFTEDEREMVYSSLIVSLYSSQLWGVFIEE